MSATVEEAQRNEFTPETLAENIFSKPPKEPNSCQLLLDDTRNDYIFELLLKVLLGGINVLYGKTAKMEDVTENIIITLKEYFASLGFLLKIRVTEKGLDQHKIFFTDVSNESYYCQIKLNNYPDYFIEYTKEHSGHDKYGDMYRFSMNGKNNKIERKCLSDYYCIYFSKDQTKKITVQFDFLT